ncbi:PEP-CTERM sorting domain-containing protein [Mariniblastus fucicola]|uniref:Ice-binding protein C-terminal domain-containing protein n=1 Tax=Mariniblastus fucicola TaxID=980251 RepID=A0A5B9P956_9BACT|nr:PEP-CTERM sorting domain-containing protein [Mariniblastus fucicola]QEG22894.1 hypothetical protein MFFC18_27820 [Mariniblastus fucicola]
MKKQIFMLFAAAAMFAMPQAAQADLIVAFDEVTGNPDGGNTQTANFALSGFSATYETDTNDFGATTSGGLADATFGTYDASAATGTGEYENGGDDHLSLNNGLEGGVNFTVTNTSGTDWNLETFHFDLGSTRPGSADTWTLSVVSGGLTAGAVGSGGPGANGGSATAAWNDYDQSLTGLADFTLADGESVEFLLDFVKDSTQGPSGHHTYIDNFAITGSVSAVPEPTSLAILGLAGLGLAIRRRK